MLKHEEMIANVHRRIAEYEEEKKMKHSAFKNIFSAIKQDTDNKKADNSEDGYTEVASGTERIKRSNNMVRMVSSIAAITVLAVGIGATGYMLHKNKTLNPGISDEDVIFTQPTETTAVSVASPASASPFGDFEQIFLYFHKRSSNNEYSDETYSRLAKYLNTFEWGEGEEIAAKDMPEEGQYGGWYYCISWEQGEFCNDIYVMENGKAFFEKLKYEEEDSDLDRLVFTPQEYALYEIDFDTFSKGIEDILKQDVPYTGDKLSPREIRKLSVGDFVSAEMYSGNDETSENIVPENDATKKALEKFLRDDLITMLSKGDTEENTGEKIYTAVRYFKTSETTIRKEGYSIYEDGAVKLCSYLLFSNGGEILREEQYYRIDTEEFKKKVNDILSGKYDEKTPDKTENTTEKTDEVQPTTMEEVTEAPQDNNSEQGGSENNSSSENSEEALFRAFYLFLHDGWDGSYYGKYEAYDENGNMVDYKDEINFLIHRAEVLPTDRMLGSIADEEDMIRKGRQLLLDLMGQEYIADHDKESYVNANGVTIYRDNPCYLATYYEDYDIWDFRPTLFSGSSEDGHFHVASPGSVPHFYVRGSDGKILGAFH